MNTKKIRESNSRIFFRSSFRCFRLGLSEAQIPEFSTALESR